MNHRSKSDNGQQMRQVFTITGRNGKRYWIRIGAAFATEMGARRCF